MSVLQDLSKALSEAAARSSGFVVSVGGGTRFGASGLLWAPGAVVTTRSTIRRDDRLRITLPGGETVAATLAGHDPGTDIAVLRYQGSGEVDRPPAQTSDVKPGDVVLALGRAENTGVNASFGLMSAVGPAWQTWQGGRLDSYLRLDVTLYPGTSGAAVVNAAGEFIGMASGALSRIAPLAVPATTIERVATQLLSSGRVRKPWFGVAVQPVPEPAGLVVLAAEATAPAARSGILVGDILVMIDGVELRDPMDLRRLLAGHAPGEAVRVVLLRGGERREFDVVLGERLTE